MMKFSENTLDAADKRNAIEDALDDIGIKEVNITETIQTEAKEAGINVNEPNKLKQLKELVNNK